MIENIGQPRLGRLIDDIGGRLPRLAHPHIERAVFLEGKAPLCHVDLHRGHAQIQHYPVQQLAGMGVELREIALHQPQPVAIFPRPVGGHLQRQRVTIYANHAICARRQQALGIAASAKSAVKPKAPHGGHSGQQRFQQHRDMGGATGFGIAGRTHPSPPLARGDPQGSAGQGRRHPLRQPFRLHKLRGGTV